MIPIGACEPYFEHMRQFVELDPDTMQLITSQLSEASFPQKHVILEEGGICNKVYFVVSGTARSHYTDPSGTTVTWAFLFNNESSATRNLFAVDYGAFLTNKPSSIAIETLSEVRLLVFLKKE